MIGPFVDRWAAGVSSGMAAWALIGQSYTMGTPTVLQLDPGGSGLWCWVGDTFMHLSFLVVVATLLFWSSVKQKRTSSRALSIVIRIQREN